MFREEWGRSDGRHPHRGGLGASIGGRYALTRELACGGMGAVWEARDLEGGELVAVKLQPSLPGRMQARRFEREVQALNRLRNRHVVRILDSGYEPGLTYLVMELLRGETLRRHLARRGPLPPAEVVQLIEQSALGLQAVHAMQTVHRDVKLSNLFLASEGSGSVLKLIDFGIARANMTSGHDATDSGIVGSPAYMSPEQTRGERIDTRTDSWALAVVAFTLLVGIEPFTESSLPATMARVCSGRPRLEGVALTEALRGFFKIAFRVDPAARFQTVTELAASLSRACAGVAIDCGGRTESTVSLHIPPDRGRGRLARWMGTTVLAAGAVFAAYPALHPAADQSSQRSSASSLPSTLPERDVVLAQSQMALVAVAPKIEARPDVASTASASRATLLAVKPVAAKPAHEPRERPAPAGEEPAMQPPPAGRIEPAADADEPAVGVPIRGQDPLDRRF